MYLMGSNYQTIDTLLSLITWNMHVIDAYFIATTLETDNMILNQDVRNKHSIDRSRVVLELEYWW